MNRIVHLCLDIRGALRWPKRMLKQMFRDPETGRWLKEEEAREALLDHVAQGHKVLPMVPGCEGFSYETGCPGHPVREGASDIRDTP